MEIKGIFLICGGVLLLLSYGEAQTNNASKPIVPVVDLKEIQKIINGPDNTTVGTTLGTTASQQSTSQVTTPVATSEVSTPAPVSTVSISQSTSTTTTTVKVSQSSSTTTTSKAPPPPTTVTTQPPTTSAATRTTPIQEKVNAKVTPPTTTTTTTVNTVITQTSTTEQGSTEPLILAPFLSELESAPEPLRERTTPPPTEPSTEAITVTTSTTTEAPTTTPEPARLGPIVEIAQGKVQSLELRSRSGKPYFAFLGVPYANSPSNFQRFKEPAPVSSWPNVLNATSYGPSCIQYNILTEEVEGEEDCLTLNIFTPKIPMGRSKKKGGRGYPVMVFFHQGAFMFGTSRDFQEKYMMDENVVLVTVNYRVGAFGFLNTEGESDAKGNQGLKDQLLALQFVRDNIHNFNGERNSVTIFGESAGAASVHYHLLSDRSRDLFHRAISMSGTALSPWAFTRSPRRMAKKLGTFLNCPTTDMTGLFECLQGKDARVIADKTKDLYEWNTDPITPFAPSVEVEASTTAFLTQSPYTLMKNGHIHSAPWMLGVVESVCLLDAWSILVNPQFVEDLNVDWHRIAPVTFMYKETALEPDAISNQIKAYYFGTKDIGNDTATNLTNLYSDRYFNHGIRTSALLHAKTNEAVPIYLYMFTYKGQQSHTKFAGITEILGASEGDELRFLFNTGRFDDIPVDSADGDISRKFIKLWTSFAREGKPADVWNGQEFKPISAAQVKGDEALMYYSLNEQCGFVEEPFSARLNFFDNLPLNENENEIMGSIFQQQQGVDYDLFAKD